MIDSKIRHLIWVDFNRNEGKNIEYIAQENNETRTTTFTWNVNNNNMTKIVEWDLFEPSISLETNFQMQNEENPSIPVSSLPSEGDIKSEVQLTVRPDSNDPQVHSEEIITMSMMSDLVWGKDPVEIKYFYDDNHHECIIEGVKYISYL